MMRIYTKSIGHLVESSLLLFRFISKDSHNVHDVVVLMIVIVLLIDICCKLRCIQGTDYSNLRWCLTREFGQRIEKIEVSDRSKAR